MQKSIARTTKAVMVFTGPKWNAMVRDGMFGGSNGPLRRQEKGKMEALGSSSLVGTVHQRQPPHPCDIDRPIATLDGPKCRKSEIGDIFLCVFLFLARQAIKPLRRLRSWWLPAPRPGQGVHFPPLVS